MAKFEWDFSPSKLQGLVTGVNNNIYVLEQGVEITLDDEGELVFTPRPQKPVENLPLNSMYGEISNEHSHRFNAAWWNKKLNFSFKPDEKNNVFIKHDSGRLFKGSLTYNELQRLIKSTAPPITFNGKNIESIEYKDRDGKVRDILEISYKDANGKVINLFRRQG